MDLLKKLYTNEEGSPTVEAVFWIVIFAGTLLAAVTRYADKVEEVMRVSTNSIVEKSYDRYCSTLRIGKDYWNGQPVPSGSKPVCQSSPRY